MPLAARKRGNPLDEIKHALRRTAFLLQDGLDDLRRLGFGETALPQEAVAVFVVTGDDPFARSLDTGEKPGGRRIGKARQRGCRLVSKALSREFGMPDGDFLKILHAPQVTVHADGAKIKRGDAERLRSDFAVPAIEPPEVQVRRTVR